MTKPRVCVVSFLFASKAISRPFFPSFKDFELHIPYKKYTWKGSRGPYFSLFYIVLIIRLLIG